MKIQIKMVGKEAFCPFHSHYINRLATLLQSHSISYLEVHYCKVTRMKTKRERESSKKKSVKINYKIMYDRLKDWSLILVQPLLPLVTSNGWKQILETERETGGRAPSEHLLRYRKAHKKVAHFFFSKSSKFTLHGKYNDKQLFIKELK